MPEDTQHHWVWSESHGKYYQIAYGASGQLEYVFSDGHRILGQNSSETEYSGSPPPLSSLQRSRKSPWRQQVEQPILPQSYAYQSPDSKSKEPYEYDAWFFPKSGGQQSVSILRDSGNQMGSYVSLELVQQLDEEDNIFDAPGQTQAVAANGHNLPICGKIALEFKFVQDYYSKTHKEQFLVVDSNHIQVNLGHDWISREGTELKGIPAAALIPRRPKTSEPANDRMIREVRERLEREEAERQRQAAEEQYQQHLCYYGKRWR